MKAVVFESVGKVRVEEIPDPVITRPDDVIVRVTRSAICGSDLHFYHGKAPISAGEGIGHEAAGVIEEVGPAIERFRPGQRVVVAFDVACGDCWFCRRGETHLCDDFRNFGAGTFGGGLPGAQAEKLLVPAGDVNLLAIPDGVDDDKAVFVGDGLTTGFYTASLGDIAPDETVAVVGCGPIGFMCVQSAKALGAGQVFALDMDDDRLALAAAAGAIPVDVRKRNPVMALSDATDGRGADVVLEAVGTPAAYQSAVAVVRRGGRIVVAGMYAGESVEVQMGVYWARALDIRFAGICPVHPWWEQVMAKLAAGELDPSPVVSHRMTLDEAPEAYELFATRRATKVLLLP